MGKVISSTKLSSTLTLSECHDGFWLYDKTQAMNLAIKAKSSTEAFVQALTYYQDRFSEVSIKHRDLRAKVEAFVEPFLNQEDEGF